MDDVFHPGERAIQEQTGERGTALLNGGLIDGRIPAPARPFVVMQRFCLLGWSSPAGDVWATLLTGPRGFARSDDEGAVVAMALNKQSGIRFRTPPLAEMRERDHVGVLFIELETRRRLRVNGRVARLGGDELVVDVEHAYPLCPKYIQRRHLKETEAEPASAGVREGVGFPDELTEWASAADTFFVASAHPDGPADVSHRGGKRGFVRVDAGVLRIPDFPGNSMFNTFGNLMLNPRAGLVFVDFATNRQLQLTGDARLDLAAGDANGETGGTGRWWEFTPRRWVVSPLDATFEWAFVDASPFNP
jgi:hypothetical protein